MRYKGYQWRMVLEDSIKEHWSCVQLGYGISKSNVTWIVVTFWEIGNDICF